MNENLEANYDESVVDLSGLFRTLRKNMVMIAIISFVCAGLALASSIFLVSKKYSSEATIYITPKVTEQGVIDYNSIQTNARMVNNYMEILKGEAILSKVADQVGLESYAEVFDSLTISNAKNTEIISIQSVTKKPELSRDIVANTISTFTEEMAGVLNINNVTVINEPKVNSDPIAPSKWKFTAGGFVLGWMISFGYVLIRFLLNKKLNTREEAESWLGIPVLAAIPWEK